MGLGEWKLEGGQEKVVLWWTRDGLARMVSGVSWDETLSTFARVLARYPDGRNHYLSAHQDLKRIHGDGTLLAVALPLGHQVALARPLGVPGAQEASDPALVAFEDIHGALKRPILTTDVEQAQEFVKFAGRTWPGLPVRIFVGERGVRRLPRDTGELALGAGTTDLEGMVESAITTAAPDWAEFRPVVRRRPHDAWHDEFVRALDEREADLR